MGSATTWVAATGFARRPLVAVEDHLHHVSELLETLAAASSSDGSLLGLTTVVCLDRSGPDTTRLAAGWLEAYPGLQVAARLDGHGGNGDVPAPLRSRRSALDPAVFTDAHRFCKTVAALLRPGGLLLQDIQLATLAFIPPDRWWESIYLANTVRGMFAGSPPACRFLSNKRGYEATFGRDLLDAGFDPRDVMDKGDLPGMVAPVVRAYLARAFPLLLQIPRVPDAAVAKTEEDRREIEAGMDLIVWNGETVEIGGRLLPDGERKRVALRAGSQEAVTWSELIADRFHGDGGGDGVPVLEVGTRLAPEGAGRAEITNLAARHLHGLRSRLQDGAAIVTANHAYRLADGLRVGRVVGREK